MYKNPRLQFLIYTSRFEILEKKIMEQSHMLKYYHIYKYIYIYIYIKKNTQILLALLPKVLYHNSVAHL